MTEGALLETVWSLTGEKTLVLVAHRLSTLKRCDVIHLMHEGRIEATGTYDELYRTNARFRAMATSRSGT